MEAAHRQLWDAVDRLIDRAPSLADLVAHRLHLLAVRRFRDTGRELPDALAMQELVALHRAAAIRTALADVRAAYDGRVLVLKGLSIGVHYPAEHLRPTVDLDVLVDHPRRAYAALVDAGFKPVGPHHEHYYDGLHHLKPLMSPKAAGPLIELHRRPNWVRWVAPPASDELLEMGVESLGIDGVLVLPPEAGALTTAVHGWGELPLRRIGDLIDVTLLRRQADDRGLAAIARSWGLERMWQTTSDAARFLLEGGPRPVPLRTWARDLELVRDTMVYEQHVRRYCGPFWAQPAGAAVATTVREVLNDVRRTPEETWANKLRRGREALLHPTRPSSEHKALLGPDGIRPRHQRVPDELDA
jgi:hypothetical protein